MFNLAGIKIFNKLLIKSEFRVNIIPNKVPKMHPVIAYKNPLNKKVLYIILFEYPKDLSMAISFLFSLTEILRAE